MRKKKRALREKGHRKQPNATKVLTVQDEEQLWKNCVLGEQNPVTPSYSVVSAHPSFWSARLPRAP